MGRKPDLADIDAAVAVVADSQRPQCWFDRLPSEAADTLLAARDKFHAGGYGTIRRLTLARILFEHCSQRGWKTCDEKRLAAWLVKTA